MSYKQYLKNKYGKITQLLIHEYGKEMDKLARYSNHLIFCLRCKNAGIIPTSLRIKPPVRTGKALMIAERASRAFLNERVGEVRKKKMVLLKTTAGTRQHLRRILSKEDFQKMECRTRTTAERTFLRVKTRHEKKLKGLVDNSPSSKPGKRRKIATNPKWVTNLSTHQLSEEQKEVLSLGLNFVPTPRRIPVKEIAASLEEGAKKLDKIPASEMRNRLRGILRRAKTPVNNMTRQQIKAVRELKAMDDVVILPADKGNSM